MVYVITVHLYAKDEESARKISLKLVEASRVYSQDKETISWFVSQSTSDPLAFTIVERYEHESVSWKQAVLCSGLSSGCLRLTVPGKLTLRPFASPLSRLQSQKYHLEVGIGGSLDDRTIRSGCTD